MSDPARIEHLYLDVLALAIDLANDTVVVEFPGPVPLLGFALSERDMRALCAALTGACDELAARKAQRRKARAN